MNKFTKRKLEDLCGSYKLSKSGNKTALINRLVDFGHNFNTNDSQENIVSN